MVKCGNCKKSHPTPRDVRDCYQSEGKTIAAHERPMTHKQREYIDRLIDTLSERPVLQEEIGGIVGYFESTYPDPTSGQASNMIEVLNNLRWLTPAPVKEEQEETSETVTFTEAEKLAATESETPENHPCPKCGVEDGPCVTKSGNETDYIHKGRYTVAS